MTFGDRIKRGQACEYVQLAPAEWDLMRDCGWYLVRVGADCEIVAALALDDGLELPIIDGHVTVPADDVMSAHGLQLAAWAQEHDGPVWFGYESNGQFCEPEKWDWTRMARVMRILGEVLSTTLE